MKIRRQQVTAAFCVTAIALFVALSYFVRPLAEGGHDSAVYLDFAKKFLEGGLLIPLYREPMYPLLLVALQKINFDIFKQIGLIQNLIFLASLFFFLRTLFHSWLTRAQTLFLAIGITLIPTFWIAINGAIYTESTAASFVLLLVAFSTRTYTLLLSTGRKPRRLKIFFYSFLIWVCSILLGFNKGSFLFINLIFPFVFLATLWGAKQKANINKVFFFLMILLSAGIMNRVALSLWFGLREGEPVFSKKLYYRGGEGFFGRIEYARQFDFRKNSSGYLLNGLSSSVCRKIYGNTCAQYNFDVENWMGQKLNHENGAGGQYTDAQLFEMAKVNAIQTAPRQVAFGFFELSKFVLHHTVTGFAFLKLPLVGPLIHSTFFSFVIKLFNVLLYLFIPFQIFRNRKRLSKIGNKIQSLPLEIRAGTLLAIAYSISLLGVHMMVTTLIRMCFPIAVFLVILNWQAYYFFKNRA